jgi:hypothetical protein
VYILEGSGKYINIYKNKEGRKTYDCDD